MSSSETLNQDDIMAIESFKGTQEMEDEIRPPPMFRFEPPCGPISKKRAVFLDKFNGNLFNVMFYTGAIVCLIRPNVQTMRVYPITGFFWRKNQHGEVTKDRSWSVLQGVTGLGLCRKSIQHAYLSRHFFPHIPLAILMSFHSFINFRFCYYFYD
ncbi:MAG: hypothetical protein MHMPM18_001044 [Marteilia pararefringens]